MVPTTGNSRGSAMVIAILVTVILSLLGISYLLMAQTENRIAENERLSDQALFMGEAGARMVKRWFDRPMKPANLINPPLAIIDRSLRQIDADGDPTTPAVSATGASTAPYYKQGIDLNSDGNDDVFDKPYRDNLYNTLLGLEAGPDMRIDENFSSAAKTFLMNLSSRLMQNYPSSQDVHARITRIDVYAPPYVEVAGTWMRYGMGTVKVMSRIYRVGPGGTEEVLAERMVKAVLNETPFPGPFGPLHSCTNLAWNGDFKVHWGVSTAVSDTDLTNNHVKVWASLPREIPPGQRLDLLWGYNNDADFAAYKAAVDGLDIEDPWFRYLSGGPIADAPNTNDQPEPFVWDGVSALGDKQQPYHSGGTDGSHSNIMQNQPMVTCPEFDYDVWKAIATSGGSDVHYYVWTSDTSFKENGFGTARTYRAITDNREGLFFFDTTDGVAPYDSDGDGLYDNLTPKITIQGGTYGVRGFVYLNSTDFQTKGVGGRTATYKMPGEPFQDKDQDGVFDAGENWINLAYPTGDIEDDIVADASDDMLDDGTTGGGVAVRNANGPEVTDEAVVWGILYTNGFWDSTGNAKYYGSVISKSGIGESSPSAGTPNLYWDEDIIKNWPPDTWDLPRVVITRWETDL